MIAKTFEIEVIVVNNNSSDETSTTILDFSKKHAWLSIIDESQQGLSHARNAGYQSAKHDWQLRANQHGTHCELRPQEM